MPGPTSALLDFWSYTDGDEVGKNQDELSEANWTCYRAKRCLVLFEMTQLSDSHLVGGEGGGQSGPAGPAKPEVISNQGVAFFHSCLANLSEADDAKGSDPLSLYSDLTWGFLSPSWPTRLDVSERISDLGARQAAVSAPPGI